MYIYILALIGTLIESISDILLKQYVSNNENIFLMAGLIGYIFIGIMFLQLLKIENLGTANIIWHVMHFSILFLFSVLYFNEHYTTREIIGLILGSISFYLLGTKHH